MASYDERLLASAPAATRAEKQVCTSPLHMLMRDAPAALQVKSTWVFASQGRSRRGSGREC
ncbi:hypothetical protein L227DRAFT_575058 [Lentinus tigrinus ALCF2SS1-6]|uniref:Uncharacterized protein n=1 Tax=Lentinus tigrinus ALCF2SS1-6 TaxID=1328759 RepID=A0A5C2SCA9_9APHY|nr:hypothetical protein L227DRAFT_575058 [Lentinus tigrinus ALCF2SS1-6]